METTITADTPFLAAPAPLPASLCPRHAAGVMFVEATSRQVLLTLRGASVAQPGTWGFPGGLADPGEDPDEAAFRELEEELGIDPLWVGQHSLKPIQVHTTDKQSSDPTAYPGTWTLFIVTIAAGAFEELELTFDHETLDAKWFTFARAIVMSNVHPGTKHDLQILKEALS